jgi:two-component system sensor histidine kinase RegB
VGVTVDWREEARRGARAERVRINMSWLLKLRRAAVIGQLATIGVVRLGLGVRVPLLELVGLVALGLLANLALQGWFLWQQGQRGKEAQEGWLEAGRHLLGAVLLLDVALLTALLYLTGGAANPFALFFFVNLVLCSVVLSGRWLRCVMGAGALCFAGLIVWQRPLPELATERFRQAAEGAGWLGFSLEAWGLLVAFLAVMSFTVYFVRRLTEELRELEAELDAARQRRADAARLESLATLAAGAAHELASPLSTIAVIAKELERIIAGASLGPGAVEDAQLIRTEVARCRKILDQMSLDAGDTVGEEIVPIAISELIEGALSKIRSRDLVRLDLGANGSTALRVPRVALTRAVRALIKNALDASSEGATVEVTVEAMGSGVVIEVKDRGRGMDAETLQRAGDPFFTTKDPGRGMGLGLFLVRTLADRLGGRFGLRSELGVGTVARLELPRSGAETPAAPGT